MKKLLLDTDIGGDIDDALCLAYLLREPRCELLGITTVCGESEIRASIADAIVKTAGAAIPIVAGADLPLQPIPAYPTPGGKAALANWPHEVHARGDAAGFLYEVIRGHPHEVTLLGIGNMTNIAMLLARHPDAAELLAGLYVMNGYFGAERLPSAYYNWNSWADPLASRRVFGARVAVHRAVTLEITQGLTLRAEDAPRLFDMTSELMRAVFDFGNPWLQNTDKLTLHDPLVAVCALHEEVCAFRRGTVRVETQDVETMGGTAFIEDARGNVEVSVSVDAERFYGRLAEVLGQR